MDHQSDVQKQPLQGQHQRFQDQNIVYIQQHPQGYRNQNFSYQNEGQANLINSQSFQDQNASFGLFENHNPYVSNGHISSTNTSATIISNAFDANKNKNVMPVRNTHCLSDNANDTTNSHQKNDAGIQLTSGNFQSLDLQSLNYQQASPFFLQNLGNHYQLNDNIVSTYQSSGSSESSDESSVSNASQLQYSSDSSGISNNQFEFPVPASTTTSANQNFHQFQQKDFLDNYMALIHQDTHVPRCDSSKSETAESTCSSLSSGSAESQSESENSVRLPLLVNPLLNNNANCNILHTYQPNMHSNISSFSNHIDHNENNDYINHRNYINQTDQNVVKCNNFTTTINSTNLANGNIHNINQILPPNNQVNNVVVMLPNRVNKNVQNQQIVQNPSSQDVLNSSKFVMQNPKVNQQKIFGLINVANPLLPEKMISPLQVNQMIKVNNVLTPENCGRSDFTESSRNWKKENSTCGVYHSVDDGRNAHNCGETTESNLLLHHSNSGATDNNCASHIQNTSDSSVINSNFVQINSSAKGVDSENNSAMLFKETSDKSISQSVSDVNSSVVDSNSVFSVKNIDSNVIKNNFCDDSSSKTCFNTNSGINVLPVPAGWRRLLVDGSIIYLSPTNIALSSIEQVKMYLQTIGTCKCGLECPVNCDSVFNFNPKVISRPWDSSDSEQTRLCNHKRKAPVSGSPNGGPDKNVKLSRKEVVPTKRKKKKNGGSCSGVSVSQLLAQRDRALAAAAGRWPSPNTMPPDNSGYQNAIPNQYQNVQVVRSQAQARQQIYENNIQNMEGFKGETTPARVPDDKVAQFPCINVINNSAREGTVLNINGMNQLLPENHTGGNELMRPSQMNVNSLGNSRQEVRQQTVLSHSTNYNQCGQEFVQNTVIGPKPEGVVLASQGMIFPHNMVMQRPRSIPPWHQTRLTLNKKQVPETPVVYEKVPYLQQQMPPPPTLIFEEASSRKKHKFNPKTKKPSQEPPPQSQPSFMDNPSAYLAQQTALLHNTISRPNFNMSSDTRPLGDVPQNHQVVTTTNANPISSATVVTNSNSVVSSGVLVPFSRNANFSIRPVANQKIDQSNFIQPQVSQKNISGKENVSNSTEVSHESHSSGFGNIRNVPFNNHVCSNTNCLNCKNSCSFSRHEKDNSNEHHANDKIKFVQSGLEKTDSDMFNKQCIAKSDWRGSECRSRGDSAKILSSRVKDESNCVEENPVTSSTEQAPVLYNQKVVSDLRPIQGGTVSTSNGSPQPQPSPTSSNVFKQEVSSPKHSDLPPPSPVLGNVQISSTNPYIAMPNSIKISRENDTGLTQLSAESFSKKDNSAIFQTSQSAGSAPKRPTSPSNESKYKFNSRNFLNVTTSSDQVVQSVSEKQEDQIKVQSVTSSLEEKNETKNNRLVRTMASSNTASSNTITSVQAGKTQTSTVTVSNNNSTSPPTTISLVNLANQNILNASTSQKSKNKSPLEMVQSVVSSIQTSELVKNDVSTGIISASKNLLSSSNTINSNILPTSANVTASILANDNSNTATVLKTSPGSLQTGHILVSSNGQYIVASNGNVIPQTNINGLKLNPANSMPPMSASPVVTNVTGAVTQVLPAVGVAQQVLGQSTVLVNAMPAPFVIQPGVMAVETGIGRLAVATGNMLQSSVIENNSLRNSIRGVAPPEKIKNKKGNKKRKNQLTSLVQMASPNNVILNQPFNHQNFAVSPGGNVQPLQALTLVQGKHGTPAQIVMNNQNNFNQFNSQPQQINLLQPVNLTSVPNFPAFQQFIVPGLGNMVMSTDGTATLLPDTNIGVQLQLQNVNGQNVLTPVQNTSFINSQGILTTPTGMFIRAPSNQQKIIQNNASPQFLSPNNSQFLVNQFQGQLSPLITASLSPNQQIFTSSPQRQSPQDFIQIIPTSTSQNTTVVQQNTTIVQQQTTMVSNNQSILNNSGKSNFILSNTNNSEKPIELQILGTSQRPAQQSQTCNNIQMQQSQQPQKVLVQDKVDFGTQHSVSTQTNVGEEPANAGVTTNNTFCQTLNSNWSGSPPDTTTHSPVESDSNYERTPTPSDDKSDGIPQAMVQYVSSSINESEGENDSYLLPGLPKILNPCENLPRINSKPKNIVESSTILQETGVQIQIGSSFVCSDHTKPLADDCVVSSHSDVNVQDKHIESQSNISSYQEDKVGLVDALLAENKANDLDDEEITDLKEKLAEGDLVWGPVRGSPAWPGKLIGLNNARGKALVRWFGCHSSPTKVSVSQLQSLSQGLEAHHRASNKGRKNRKLNVELEAAIQEAMIELDRMTAKARKISSGRGRPRRLNR